MAIQLPQYYLLKRLLNVRFWQLYSCSCVGLFWASIPLHWPAYLFLNHYCGSWPLWLTAGLRPGIMIHPVLFLSAYDWFCSLGPFMLLFEFWFTNSVEMSLGWMHWICLVLSVAATFRVPQSVHLLVTCFSGARKISLRSSITLLLDLFLHMLRLLWIEFFVKIY